MRQHLLFAGTIEKIVQKTDFFFLFFLYDYVVSAQYIAPSGTASRRTNTTTATANTTKVPGAGINDHNTMSGRIIVKN